MSNREPSSKYQMSRSQFGHVLRRFGFPKFVTCDYLRKDVGKKILKKEKNTEILSCAIWMFADSYELDTGEELGVEEMTFLQRCFNTFLIHRKAEEHSPSGQIESKYNDELLRVLVENEPKKKLTDLGIKRHYTKVQKEFFGSESEEDPKLSIREAIIQERKELGWKGDISKMGVVITRSSIGKICMEARESYNEITAFSAGLISEKTKRRHNRRKSEAMIKTGKKILPYFCLTRYYLPLLNNLGVIALLGLGRTGSARYFFRRAVAIDPNYRQAASNLNELQAWRPTN